MASEQHALQVSILATLVLACAGVVFGLYAGSQSIVFDGLFNAIDASMAVLALLVSRLLLRQPGRRFQQGYWHIEPMVLALNGSVLVMLCGYALINSLAGLMQGGRSLPFDHALVYALLTATGSALMYDYQRRLNGRLQSALIALDLHSWLMSTAISLALLIAFAAGLLLQDGIHAWLVPYIDPLVLALLTMALIPAPCRTVYRAMQQILRITPGELDAEIAELIEDFSRRYGFERCSHCVSQIGRGLFVEIHILLPASMNAWPVTRLDDIRSEIASAIGRQGQDRWLAIDFTRDGRWL